MSDCNVTQRDLDSLGVRLDTRIDALRELMDERDRLGSTALREAKEGMEARLHSMNEFKALIMSERGGLVPRVLHEADMQRLLDKIAVLEKWQANLQGRMQAGNILAIFISLLISGFGVFLANR